MYWGYLCKGISTAEMWIHIPDTALGSNVVTDPQREKVNMMLAIQSCFFKGIAYNAGKTASTQPALWKITENVVLLSGKVEHNVGTYEYAYSLWIKIYPLSLSLSKYSDMLKSFKCGI